MALSKYMLRVTKTFMRDLRRTTPEIKHAPDANEKMYLLRKTFAAETCVEPAIKR